MSRNVNCLISLTNKTVGRMILLIIYFLFSRRKIHKVLPTTTSSDYIKRTQQATKFYSNPVPLQQPSLKEIRLHFFHTSTVITINYINCIQVKEKSETKEVKQQISANTVLHF